ncbi:MAG: DUF2130 domain-containing protein [Streptococcus parasanguinis]
MEQHCGVASLTRIAWLCLPQMPEFGKDNDARSPRVVLRVTLSYREVDENGVEILSIMFEMKNEADGTATKHRECEHFFKELDKDRREKGLRVCCSGDHA